MRIILNLRNNDPTPNADVSFPFCTFSAGLGGELRGGKRLDERIREAQKMGFQRIIVPKASASRFNSQAASSARGAKDGKLTNVAGVVECRTLYDVVAAAFVNPEVSRSLSNRRARRKNSSAGLHGPARHFQSGPKRFVDEEEASDSAAQEGDHADVLEDETF